MLFPHEVEVDPALPAAALAGLPEGPAVFALRGVAGEPYLNRTANLRTRLTRLLTPAPTQSRRLQLAGMVRRVAWAETASDFESLLLLYRAASAVFGDGATKRLRLHAPFFLRMGMSNRFPRLWVTNAISARAAGDLFGPFASRHAAERYAEAVLDLYLLRRCFQDLEPDPAFPGCIYSEMKKCLAPCFGGCSDERYESETAAVHAFLETRGASLLQKLAVERDRASEALDFEGAAAAHARWVKAEAVAATAPEIAGSLGSQRAVLVQPSTEPDAVELFGVQGGVLRGPVRFSLLGMRLPNEQSGSTSLFAHPAALLPVPLEPAEAVQEGPEERLQAALAELWEEPREVSKEELGVYQGLLARWYFRPVGKREGEIVLAQEGGERVHKAVLRASARVLRAQVERRAPVVSRSL